jgi:hypothetical protein
VSVYRGADGRRGRKQSGVILKDLLEGRKDPAEI